MTEEYATYLVVKDTVDNLPAETKEKVTACAELLRTNILAAGAEGYMALALLGSEFAAKEKL